MALEEIAKIVGTVLFSVAGGGAVTWALSSWLGKVWATRILQKEQNALQKERDSFHRESALLLQQRKSEHEKKAFVHSQQFKREFSVYEELWKCLVELRSAAVGLRPIVDFMDGGKGEEEIKKERLERLSKALIDFWESFEKNRPFFSEDVYQACREINSTAFQEGNQYKRGKVGAIEDKYWKDAEENAKKITELAENICACIRERINSVEVIDKKAIDVGNK